MDRLKYFESEFKTQRRRGNNYVTALGRLAVGPSVNISFPEQISECTCPIVYQIFTHNTARGSSCAFWNI